MIKLNSNYNFYTLLIASIVIGSPIIFLKNDILKKISITEEIILVSLGILAIVSSIYFIYEKNSLQNLIDEYITNYQLNYIIHYNIPHNK